MKVEKVIIEPGMPLAMRIGIEVTWTWAVANRWVKQRLDGNMEERKRT